MATSSRLEAVGEQTIEQFIAVTGAARSVAQSLLEACSGNLDLAVGMHMDSGQAGPSSGAPDVSPVITGLEEGIRAPIPQKTEVLVEEDAASLGSRMRRPRRFARSVFDGFRDFQAESNNFADSLRGKRQSKKRNLEDLFRPPIDITHKGTFQSARDLGSAQNRWLLVNVQNVQEFPCQVLNRDVWSNVDARTLIKDSFIFWQVYNDSEEGKRFMQFYKVNQWPYVAVIDPFTGENQVVWHKISDGTVFCELARDFLSLSSVPDASQISSAAKRQKQEPTIVDASEQEQLEAAIQASLCENEKKPSSSPQYVCSSDSEPDVIQDSDDDDVETFSDSDDILMSSPQPAPNSSTKSTNGVSPSRKHQSSTSSHTSSSLSVTGSSVSFKPISKTCSKKTSQLNRLKALASSAGHSSNSSSSTSSSQSQPSTSSSSSSSKYSSLNKLTKTVNTSEIRINYPHRAEKDDENNRTEDRDRDEDDEEVDPRVSAIWGSSSPLPSSGDAARRGLMLGPPEVIESNSLLDIIGSRDAEVSTPEVCALDDDGEESPDGQTAEKETDGSCESSQEGQEHGWKLYWGSSNDPVSKIMLRFPDNKREQVELPSSSQLKALSVYCASRGYEPSDYELVTNFPRRKLSQMDSTTTLKEAGLHPQDTVFVQDL